MQDSSSNAVDTETGRTGFSSAIALCVATLLFIIALALNVLPTGVPGEWQWITRPLHSGAKLILPLLVVLPLCALCITTLRKMSARAIRIEGRFLAAAVVLAFLMSTAVMYMHPQGALQATSLILNPASNSYYQTAIEYPTLHQLLDNYQQKMPAMLSHAQTQTPGPVVLHWLLHRLFVGSGIARDVADVALYFSAGVNCETAAQLYRRVWGDWITPERTSVAFWISLTLCALGSLAVVPLFFLIRRLLGAEAAVGAVAVFVVTPTVSLFSPSVDQLYPVVTLSLLCLTERVIDTLKASRLGAACVWASVGALTLDLGIFANLGLMVLAMMIAVYLFLRASAGGDGRTAPRWQILIVLMTAVAVSAAAFALLVLLFHLNILAVFHVSDIYRQRLYAGPPPRTYWKWLVWSPLDFFIFAGLPLVWLFFQGVVKDRARGSLALAATRPFAAAFLVTLIALDLSGKVRGESGRMWMFLMPCLLPHAIGCLRVQRWSTYPVRLIALVVLQTAVLVALREYVLVWGY